MSEEPAKSTARSPLSGCAILITALAVVVFLVVFSTWTLFRQFDEIAKFTQSEQTMVPRMDVSGQEFQMNGLTARLKAFQEKLNADEHAELVLTPEDMNRAIAAWEPFEELRGTFHVDSAADGKLQIGISFPLNGKPRLAKENEVGLMVSDPRYLEGTMVAVPAVSGREVVLRIEDLRVPGKQVPREFIEQMSPYRITERYTTDQVIGPAMAKLTKVEVRDGAVALIHVPGQMAEGYLDDATVDASGNRLLTLLGVAACLFLMVAGLIVFAGLRKSARNEGNS